VDPLFNDLTRLAYRNWDNLIVAERLLRLAFKGQRQRRATVETLGNLRNLPMVIARQANIAHGSQHVNKCEPMRTREIQSEPITLLEQTHGEWLDTGATGAGIPASSHLDAVGAVHGAEDA
jgi:hypothetical protein